MVRKPVKSRTDAQFSTRDQSKDKMEIFKFESSRQLQQSTDQGATKANEMETQHDRDARYGFDLLPRASGWHAFGQATNSEFPWIFMH